MRAIMDTNVIISGLFWKGQPSRILDLGQAEVFIICLTPKLLHEIEKVLTYDRLQLHLQQSGKTKEQIMAALEETCLLALDPKIPPIIKEDPTDDIIMGAALAHQADFIISGDQHLLKLKDFQNIPILSPREFLAQYE